MSARVICEKRLCSGCKSCAQACPKKAITFEADSEGFWYPVIDQKKCVNCGICEKVCPAASGFESRETSDEVFACWSSDEVIRRESASGGLFYELARTVLGEDGVVFGAAYDEKYRVFHTAVDSLEGLKKLQGSKYVQSDIGESFISAEKLLREGRTVLFSGTPCQIAGFNNYLAGREHKGKLYTCDLICHGVPSVRFYNDYLKYMQKKKGSELERVQLRCKIPDWYVFSAKLDFKNGKEYICDVYRDPYLRGFLRELVLRPCCSKCLYTSTKRVSDITMADFWGYRESCAEDADDKKGISVALCSTERGKELFDRARVRLKSFPRPLSDAKRGNRCLSEPYPASPLREAFWADYEKKSFAYIVKKYLYPEKTEKKPFMRKLLGAKRYGTYVDLRDYRKANGAFSIIKKAWRKVFKKRK